MTTLPRFTWVDLLLLLLVLAAAAGLRAGYLNRCADNGRGPGPFAVQDDRAAEVEALTANLRDRHGFAARAPFAREEEQTAHTSPGYPHLLGLLSNLPLDVPRVVRWVQAGLGALTAALYFLFARRAFHSRFVGLLAGVLGALHPFWVVNTAELDDGVLATFLLAAVLCLGTRAADGGSSLASLLYGLSLAALALVRAALLPLAFVALLWFLWRCRRLSRGWLYALLAFLGFANGIAPWTLRNVQTQHGLTPIVNSSYFHLWTGNSPQATGGPVGEDKLLQGLADLRGEELQAVADRLAELPQSERYGSLAADVVEEVRRNPAGTLQRRLWAALYFVFGRDFFSDGRLWRQVTTDAEASRAEPGWLDASLPALLFGTLLGMLLLGGLGWRWTYGWRKESMPSPLVLIWLPLPYLLGHAEALQGPRLPLDGLLLCYAAFALACLVPGVGGAFWHGGEGS